MIVRARLAAGVRALGLARSRPSRRLPGGGRSSGRGTRGRTRHRRARRARPIASSWLITVHVHPAVVITQQIQPPRPSRRRTCDRRRRRSPGTSSPHACSHPVMSAISGPCASAMRCRVPAEVDARSSASSAIADGPLNDHHLREPRVGRVVPRLRLRRARGGRVGVGGCARRGAGTRASVAARSGRPSRWRRDAQWCSGTGPSRCGARSPAALGRPPETATVARGPRTRPPRAESDQGSMKVAGTTGADGQDGDRDHRAPRPRPAGRRRRRRGAARPSGRGVPRAGRLRRPCATTVHGRSACCARWLASWCSTSACPGWTASRSAGGCARSRTATSSCSRRARRRSTRRRLSVGADDAT